MKGGGDMKPQNTCLKCWAPIAWERNLCQRCKCQPVRDYPALAAYTFKIVARETYYALVRMGLTSDWEQEIQLAAWEAKRGRLRLDTARRFCARAAYHALKRFGFVRGRGSRGYRLRETAYTQAVESLLQG